MVMLMAGDKFKGWQKMRIGVKFKDLIDLIRLMVILIRI